MNSFRDMIEAVDKMNEGHNAKHKAAASAIFAFISWAEKNRMITTSEYNKLLGIADKWDISH